MQISTFDIKFNLLESLCVHGNTGNSLKTEGIVTTFSHIHGVGKQLASKSSLLLSSPTCNNTKEHKEMDTRFYLPISDLEFRPD